MKKNVIITGGDGVLASYVKRASQGKFIVYAPSKSELDITNFSQIDAYFSSKNPDAIFHLAAKTNVDECEKNPDSAFLVNSEGTKYIAQACKKYNIKLLYVSTAAVFSGEKGPYTEDDEPDPINVYGKSKLLGETYIRKILPDATIVRIAWLIGGGKHEKKFISYVIKNIEENQKEMPVVSDIFGSIAYAKEVADFIISLFEENKNGIYHFGSKGIVTRVDIANKIVSLERSLMKIIPVESSYFDNQFIAPRPKKELLQSKKAPFKRNWKRSLIEYYETELL